MTACSIGDIVAVEFPFSDLQGQKRRPGLVLAGDDRDVLLARLTTHPSREGSDVAMTHWAEAGLPKSSTICLTKLAAIDRRLFHHVIGRLHSADQTAVAAAWQAFAATVTTALNG